MGKTRGGAGLRSGILAALWILTVAGGAAAADVPGAAGGIVNDADLSYHTSFFVACDERLWNRILDNPQVWDKLWSIYRFKPHYRVAASGTSAHITAPRGAVGDLSLASKSGGRRVYLGRGALHHPRVPQLPLAQMAMVIDARPSGKGMSGTVALYIQAESAIARPVVKSFASPLTEHIGRMTDLYIQAFKIIIDDVAHHPYGRVSTTDTPEAKEVVRALFP
jgi:hypothetical protein